VRATGDLRSARAVLSAVLGGAAVEKFALSGQLAARRFTTDKLEQLIVRALRKRMDLRQSELDVRQRGEDVRRAKGSYLPRIDAFGSYGHSWEELDEDGGDDWTIGVQARWDLFQGGRYDRLKQAQAARRMAEAQRSRLANEIRAEVTQAQARLESAASRVVLTARALDHAQENLRLARTRYENQLITITELLRAQTAEVRARLDLLNSRYEHYVGYAALLRATGSLNDVSAFVRDTRQPTEEK
jgi:outer membrane protein TolC